MNSYTQLTIEQRYQIYGLKKAGFSQTTIASELKLHKSTISRGLRPKETLNKSIDLRNFCPSA